MPVISCRSPEGEEGLAIGDVEALDNGPVGEEGRDVGVVAPGHDDLLAQGRAGPGRSASRSCPARR